MAADLASLRNRVESSLTRAFPDGGWMVGLNNAKASAPRLHVTAPDWPEDLGDLRGDNRIDWTRGTIRGGKTAS